MSTIFFPGWHAESPSCPWLYRLCSQCGQVDRTDPTAWQSFPVFCRCKPRRGKFATVSILTVNEDEIWRRLTAAHVPDHVIGRVLRLMYGTEEP